MAFCLKQLATNGAITFPRQLAIPNDIGRDMFLTVGFCIDSEANSPSPESRPEDSGVKFEKLFAQVSRRFGFKLVPLEMSNGYCAIDVDNERTFEVTERLLAKRNASAA